MKLVWYNHLKINEVIDDKLLLPNHSTVKDLMIPTPTRLKYIPILKFISRVTLKKGKTLNQNYSDFEIQIIQNRI